MLIIPHRWELELEIELELDNDQTYNGTRALIKEMNNAQRGTKLELKVELHIRKTTNRPETMLFHEIYKPTLPARVSQFCSV